MAAILGISAFYHDSAAALVVDGTIVAAAQEERFSRRKHDARFPSQAIAFCLAQAGLSERDLDFVAFYEKPLNKFDRLLETYLAFSPRGFQSFAKAIPLWLRDKVHIKRNIRSALPQANRAKWIFTEHHESHAASAFFPSPFHDAAILTMDGVGEWATTTFGMGCGNHIDLQAEISFPHSLGLLYSAFTYHCGFRVNSGEYKLMGLAPFGIPVYADRIRQHLIDIKRDGSFWLNMDYFDYCHGLTMTNRRFSDLFGVPVRKPESPLNDCHCNLAASIQQVTEEIVLLMARHVRSITGCPRLVLAGGVALNCVANGKLYSERLFDDIWVQPAAGDAGGALGAAMFVEHQLLDQPRRMGSQDSMQSSLLGPSYSTAEIQSWLQTNGYPYQKYDDEQTLCSRVAEFLVDGRVVGWFQGRMEYGPRALGGRSILADARLPDMQSELNRKIKYRENFRPFAPIVKQESASEWFQVGQDFVSPYMLMVAPVRESRRLHCGEDQQQSGLGLQDWVQRVRSTIPAVTHVDYSARIQTVAQQKQPRLHRLLSEFQQRTGCPVLVNTSFNVRGEPIVCTPGDAVRCFLSTEMDVLVLEDLILVKSEMPNRILEAIDREKHLSSFTPD